PPQACFPAMPGLRPASVPASRFPGARPGLIMSAATSAAKSRQTMPGTSDTLAWTASPIGVIHNTAHIIQRNRPDRYEQQYSNLQIALPGHRDPRLDVSLARPGTAALFS